MVLIVTLKSASLMGGHGFTMSLSGSLTVAVVTSGDLWLES